MVACVMETGLVETLGAAGRGAATVAGLGGVGAAAKEVGGGVELPGTALGVAGALPEPEPPDLIWKPLFIASSKPLRVASLT